MRYCKRASRCNYCGETIDSGQPVVIGKLWRKGTSARRWPMMFRWHPDCWVKQGLDSLGTYSSTRPRRIVGVSDMERKRRELLVREYGMCKVRLREAIIDMKIDRIQRLMARIEEIRDEVAKLGGVPKRWQEDAEL